MDLSIDMTGRVFGESAGSSARCLHQVPDKTGKKFIPFDFQYGRSFWNGERETVWLQKLTPARGGTQAVIQSDPYIAGRKEKGLSGIEYSGFGTQSLPSAFSQQFIQKWIVWGRAQSTIQQSLCFLDAEGSLKFAA